MPGSLQRRTLQDSQRDPIPRLPRRPRSHSRSARAWTPALGGNRAGSQASCSTSTRTARWRSTTTMATRRSECCGSMCAPRRARHPKSRTFGTGRRPKRRVCRTGRLHRLRTKRLTAKLGRTRSSQPSPRQPRRRGSPSARLLAPQPLARRRIPGGEARAEWGPRGSTRRQRWVMARRTSG